MITFKPCNLKLQHLVYSSHDLQQLIVSYPLKCHSTILTGVFLPVIAHNYGGK